MSNSKIKNPYGKAKIIAVNKIKESANLYKKRGLELNDLISDVDITLEEFAKAVVEIRMRPETNEASGFPEMPPRLLPIGSTVITPFGRGELMIPTKMGYHRVSVNLDEKTGQAQIVQVEDKDLRIPTTA